MQSRSEQLAFFNQMDYPYTHVCAEVEVHPLLDYCEHHHISSYLALMHIFMGIAHQTEWMATRIRGNDTIRHQNLRVATTMLGKDRNVRFIRMNWLRDFKAFLELAQPLFDQARESDDFTINFDSSELCESDDIIILSCLPWLRFTSVGTPVPLKKPDQIPRIGWGKYTPVGDKIIMPVGIHANHAVADGYQLCVFFQDLERIISAPEQWFA
ncbi:CatA-like O-acetyltransferase [Parendozoicomonas haliclonae]|uniref:Chloramphenicol acetyltransferase n=1 Tax=Parendozoicomonas haliclonae TaxID=1960125 RepID=A0A1X7AKC0_9GAMM|nr:CatA-like O-acetyltransferase [Parendozoicomonas haliclonae]SMA47036.1 Chloramphenicol acetyltransferase [Parendozoicomonas haliclonae]